MHLRLTITGPGLTTPVEVVVDADPADRVGDLAAAVAARLGVPAGSLSCGATGIPADQPVGVPPVLDGASLSLGMPPTRAPGSPSVLDLVVTSGPDAGRGLALTPGRHVIGRAASSALVIDDPDLSREHAAITVAPDGVHLTDLGSTNGTWLGDARIPSAGTPVTTRDTVRMGATTLRLRGPGLHPASVRPTGEGTLAVNRSPRIRPTTPGVRLVRPAAPMPPTPSRTPWLAMLLPIPLCGLLAVWMGPQMLLFAIMSPVLMGGHALTERWGGRRRYAAELTQHDRALVDLEARVAAAVTRERHDLEVSVPDTHAILLTARLRGRRLWERSRDDADLLTVRVGRASVPATMTVADPDDGYSTHHPTIPRCPLAVDVAAVGSLGIAGPESRVVALGRLVLGQLATLVSPHDLTLSAVGLVGDTVRLGRLPHHRELGLDDIIDEIHRRVGATNQSGHPDWTGPRHVLVVAGPAVHDPRVTDITRLGPAVGVHVIALADTTADLPAGCGAVLSTTGELTVTGAPTCTDVVVDGVGPWWAERLCRALAPLRDASAQSGAHGIPDRVGLIDVIGHNALDPRVIAAQWAADTGGADAIVGVSASGPHRLDLATDGPHALVGGTTGSGKSEFLQTLVTSLALTHSPEQLSFVLVDYKGGAAFSECARLPHVVGLVTDLDAHLTSRALTSLEAELRRRERLFAAVGAVDLPTYRARRAPSDPPIARLVIVIDEFRMLAEELPTFLDGMVRIASLGRSMGVHLVLATQRPGGVVSADITANVNLRIALRVRDRADSDDVIESPEAVAISADTPGRALARSGGFDLVEFQSARVGGHRRRGERRPLTVRLAGEPRAPETARADGNSDLVDLVAAVRAAAEATGAATVHTPWCPPLPDAVPATPEHPLGIVDLPDEQRVDPLTWHPDDPGHWLIAGRSRSGRTSVLRTVAAHLAGTFSSDELQLYAVDSGSAELAPLADWPHTGAVVDVDDGERLRRLVSLLGREVARRREVIAAAHCTSLAELAGRDPAAPARLVLLVDGWDRLDKSDDVLGSAAVLDSLVTLLRDGESAGLRAVVTGGRDTLFGRTSAVFGHRHVLALPDPADAVLAGLSRSDVPLRQPPGRAVRVTDARTVQFAHLGVDPSGASQRAALAEITTTCRRDGHRRPPRVESLPARLTTAELPDTARDAFAVGGNDLDPIRLDPDVTGRLLLVAGPSRSGRSTTLATMALAWARSGHPVAVVTGGHTTLANLVQGRGRIEVVDPSDDKTLITVRREHPNLAVLVDDADRLIDLPIAATLHEIAGLVDRDAGLVAVSATTATVATQFRGIASEIARRHCGILLAPWGVADGDVFGRRLGRCTDRGPGRGVFVTPAGVTPIQVAEPVTRSAQ